MAVSSSPVPSRPSGGRALVLGGGGSTGNAWLIGVIAGLAQAGVDVTTADLIVGTSAGATTAVQVACESPVDMLDAVLAADVGASAVAWGVRRSSATSTEHSRHGGGARWRRGCRWTTSRRCAC